jgi:FkbM family methyltransferase
MLKQVAKTAIVQIVAFALRCLPYGIRQRLVVRGLHDTRQEDLLSLVTDAIARFPIVAVVTRGQNGTAIGDLHDRAIFQKYVRGGAWAERTVKLFTDHFASTGGGTFIDVGANIGLTTLPIAAAGNVDCHAIEPERKNFSFLETNLLLNGISDKVTRINAAVADAEGEISFELSPDNYGDHRIRLRDGVALLGENQWEVQKVRTLALDSLGLHTSRNLAIKIDVQGAEPLVFAGGRQTLAAADLVIFEFSPYWMARMGLDPQPMIDALAGWREIHIARSEHGEASQPLSPEAAARELRSLHERFAGTVADGYWDVILRR